MTPPDPPLSLVSASFVARELGYRMTGGWAEGDAATQAAFRPPDTFSSRFGALLDEVVELGFDAVDLWGAHLHPDWAGDEHLAAAREALATRGLRVTSLAAWCHDLAAVEGFVRVAAALDCDLIAGGAPVLEAHRDDTVALLEAHGVRLALENHPEKDPEALLDQIGDGAGGRIGAAPDLGWWGVQGYDAPEALRRLAPYLFAVHAKDVRSVGEHDTCTLGDGVVDIEGSVAVLLEIGFDGPIGVEHEPEIGSPHDDLVTSRERLIGWLEGRS